jgi:acid phosphatase
VTRRLAAAASVATAVLAAVSAASASEPAAPAPPDAIVAYHDSGEWARDTARVAGRARRFLARHVAGVRRPALVLDIDDTSLSTYDCLRAVGFDRSVPTTCAKDARLPAIAPVRSLYRDARRRHVTVFFVTGRRESMRAPTIRNLAGQGFGGPLQLVLRTEGHWQGSNAQYKAGARGTLERRGWTIVANVGDQRSDLAGGHALRGFKLPNPMYVTQ